MSKSLSQILKKAQKGNSKAQMEFYQLSYKAVYNSCFRVLSTPEDAADITHDTYIHVYDRNIIVPEEAFIIPWTTDTFAYFSGMMFGKRKLLPRVSPKKTIEGSIGGFVASFVLSLLFSIFLVKGISYTKIMLIILIASILAQLGDLVASYVKREYGLKDFGRILPGHGGVMDRFDSVIVVVSFLYLCQVFL